MVSKAWLRIRFRNSGKLSPFLQVDIHHLPSGECEAEIKPKPGKRVNLYTAGYKRFRSYVRRPYYGHNSVFCIGEPSTILEKLKKTIHEAYPNSIELDDITINYHKGQPNGASEVQ